jgi:hypothetical protein
MTDLVTPISLEEYNKRQSKKVLQLKWAFIFTMFFLMFIVTDIAHVWYHEKVHATIYDQYNVKYNYGWKFEGVALVFYVESNDMRNCDVVCMSLQMENEIYAYNLAYIFYSLWMIFFVYLIKCVWDEVIKKHD